MAVDPSPLEMEVCIEVPRGSFVKRGSTGAVDFVSPVPCPFNYGSVPAYLGLEGDLLDAVVLGPSLPRGACVKLRAWAAIGMTDRGMYDDKLICSLAPPSKLQRYALLGFFHLYARAKRLLNILRGRRGRNACEGWCDASAAMARATRRSPDWQGPEVPF
jgi:inorganic pyrophosphatase